MALLTFIHNSNPRITAAYFDHGTPHGSEALDFVRAYCSNTRIQLVVEKIQREKPAESSPEQHWRDERYKFLWDLPGRVATAHHLNDVAETYLWGCAHGAPKIIFYRQLFHGKMTNVVRPFLTTPKEELVSWCLRHKIPFITDPSNGDDKYTRNRIRNQIVPEMLKVNPGFLGMVKQMLVSRLHASCNCKGGLSLCNDCAK